MRAKAAEAHLLDIARSEARERRKSEEEVARLTTVVNDGYSKIASVEAMAQQLQDSMNALRSQLQDRGSELAVSTIVSPTAALTSSQRATLSPEALRLRDQLQKEREHQLRLQQELSDLKASMGYGDVSGSNLGPDGGSGPVYVRRESPIYRSGSPSPKRESRPGSTTAQSGGVGVSLQSSVLTWGSHRRDSAEDGNSTLDASMLSEDGLPAPPRTATEFAADLQFDLETRQAHAHALSSQESTTWRTMASAASPSGRPPLPSSSSAPPSAHVPTRSVATAPVPPAAPVAPASVSASFEGRVPLPLPHTSSSSSLAGFQPRSDAPSPASQAPGAGGLNGSLYSEVGLPDPTPAKPLSFGATVGTAGPDSGLRQALRNAYVASPNAADDHGLDPNAFADDDSQRDGDDDEEEEEGEAGDDGYGESFDSDDDVSGLLDDSLRAAAAAQPVRHGASGGLLRGGSQPQQLPPHSRAAGGGGPTAGAATAKAWGSMAAGDTDSGASSEEEDA